MSPAGKILVVAIYQTQRASTTNMLTSIICQELMKLWSLEHEARGAARPADDFAYVYFHYTYICST